MAQKAVESQQAGTERLAPAEKRKTTSRTDIKPRPLPPYAVILHNDSVNGFDFVVRTLKKVFGYGTGKAFWLTLKAHTMGRSIVWSGSLEVAELKAEQFHAAGPDPMMMHRGARPLKVTTERLPG